MLERMRRFIIEKRLLRPGDTCFVGFSAGADSTLLLYMLKQLENDLSITVKAFHVNHCLRGEESDTDEKCAELFCEKHQITLDVYSRDVREMARDLGCGLEEAGRKARRDICEEIAGADPHVRIAFAHHMDDNAETVLFNLSRGSSVRGAAGIAPESGYVIRPMLIFTREEIEKELEHLGYSWRTDSSNLSFEHTRNRIRHNVLKYLKENVNSRAAEHITAAAADISECMELVEKCADAAFDKCVKAVKDGMIILPELSGEAHIVQMSVALEAVKSLSGTRKDVGRTHLENILRLLEARTGSSCDLPYGILARKDYEGVLLTVKEKTENTALEPVILPENGEIRFGGVLFRTKLISGPVLLNEIPKKIYTKYLDYDKINGSCFVRSRQNGDHLYAGGNGGRQKLKEYFINEKVPAGQRGTIPLVCSGSHVLWVVGMRISEAVKVTEDTKRILKIEAVKEK